MAPRTVRARILAATLTLTALALSLSGSVAYALQRGHILATSDESLRRHADEFLALKESGTDPQDERPFAMPEELVTTAIRFTVPAPDEGILGLREGKRPLAPAQDGALDLREDPDLVAAVTADMLRDEIRIRTIETPVTTYRAMIAPAALATPAGATSSTTTAGGRAAFVVAVDRTARLAEFNAVARTYLLVALLALAATGLVGWIVAGRLLRPIRELSAAARRVSDEDLSQRIEPDGDTDLADLAQTFNDMLSRLDAAFRSQRDLLDDVGHELRTPLTVIRGHLELMDPADAEDTTQTRQIALDEVDRMDRLVTDLTTLATAESPGFLRPQPADLGTLTDDVYDRARSMSDHAWKVTGRAEAPLTVDPQRIIQAWLQLCSNAAKFSEPAGVIEIGSRATGGEALIWVRDHGRGIAADDLERVRQRFSRGTATKHIEGSGLGLSIVEAIVRRHGGTVDIDSTVGAGTTVTLRLPVPESPWSPSDDAPEIDSTQGDGNEPDSDR